MLYEMQAALSRIWTRVAESTNYNDNRYAMSVSTDLLGEIKKKDSVEIIWRTQKEGPAYHYTYSVNWTPMVKIHIVLEFKEIIT